MGSIISCYLFKTYPFENEGFLTQMKSKIVNRKNLNLLGEKLRLTDFIQNGSHGSLGENISGNLFEAFIGAIYLDFGYETCQDIVLERLFSEKDIERLEHKIVSYKGLLLEWSQKKKVSIKYETTEEILPNKSFIFRTCVYLNQEKIASATESSKKKQKRKLRIEHFIHSIKKKISLKNKKIFLELEDDEAINIGLIRQAKRLPDYEMFFEINKLNSFNFCRINDLKYKKFNFPKFETYHPETKTCYHIVANKSIPIRKRPITSFFRRPKK